MDPARRWRDDLLARTIPPEILAAAPESPWVYPTALFRSRGVRALEGPPTPTAIRALEALPEGGTVLDVGCGGGATSLPLAGRAGRLVGVDGSPDMLAVFLETIGREAVGDMAEVRTVEGTWPQVATQVPHADVAVCGHVLYNVQDLAPFARALDAAARRVVVELTDRHPLRWMNDLWRTFHDVTFPDGPTANVAQEALASFGFDVHRDMSDASRGHGGLPTRQDAVAMIRQRLCLSPERDAEVADALGDRLREEEGGWSAGPSTQSVVTLWWDAAAPR